MCVKLDGIFGQRSSFPIGVNISNVLNQGALAVSQVSHGIREARAVALSVKRRKLCAGIVQNKGEARIL
jgi:hypothetical protein